MTVVLSRLMGETDGDAENARVSLGKMLVLSMFNPF